MPTSLNDRTASAAETHSLALIKKKNVTSNVKQLEPSQTKKIAKIATSALYTANTQRQSPGTDYFTN